MDRKYPMAQNEKLNFCTRHNIPKRENIIVPKKIKKKKESVEMINILAYVKLYWGPQDVHLFGFVMF